MKLLMLLLVTGVFAHGPSEDASQTPTCTETAAVIDSIDDLSCCFNKPDLQHCLDEGMMKIAKLRDIPVIMEEFNEARKESKEIENFCHVIAHALGRTAAARTDNIGEAFHECDMSCHAGCYHGVIETVFFTEEQRDAGIEHLEFDQIAEVIPRVCKQAGEKSKSKAFRAQCQHGLGHAILFTLDYALEDALKGCDLLSTEYGRQTCYIGVFTENVTASEQEKRNLKKDDPLFPCNMLPEKYLRTCYKGQTKVMIHMGFSETQIVEACGTLGVYAEECFEGLGRDKSPLARLGRFADAAAVCNKTGLSTVVPEGTKVDSGTQACIRGLAYALIDNENSAKVAFPFCNAVAEGNRAFCYHESLRYLNQIFERDRKALLKECSQFADSEQLCEKEAIAVTRGVTMRVLAWIFERFQ